MASFRTVFEQLRSIVHQFDATYHKQKSDLLKQLGQQIPSPGLMQAYMDALLFIRSYPGDEKQYRSAEKELKRLSVLMRKPANRYQKRYDKSGLPYAPVVSRFSPDLLRWVKQEKLFDLEIESYADPVLGMNDLLRLTLPPAEKEMTTAGFNNEELLSYLGVKAQQALPFILEELEQFSKQPLLKDLLFESSGIRARLLPTGAEVSRAFNCMEQERPFFHTDKLTRFDHAKLLKEPLAEPVRLDKTTAEQYIRVIRLSLALAGRETDPATYTLKESLRCYELGRGLTIALYGIMGERQLPYEQYVGFTLFKNGLPVSYGGAWVFGKRAMFGINILEAFRGGESGYIFMQVLRTYCRVFGLSFIEVEPYQYGLNNPEGIDSGAFWFYYRYGFRPTDKALNKLAAAEWKKICADKKYRTPRRTLIRFTESNMALNLGIGEPPSVRSFTLKMTALIKKQYKGSRRTAVSECTTKLFQALNSQAIGYTQAEFRVLEEMALLHAVNREGNKSKLQALEAMIRTKSFDIYAYQEHLKEYLGQV